MAESTEPLKRVLKSQGWRENPNKHGATWHHPSGERLWVPEKSSDPRYQARVRAALRKTETTGRARAPSDHDGDMKMAKRVMDVKTREQELLNRLKALQEKVEELEEQNRNLALEARRAKGSDPDALIAMRARAENFKQKAVPLDQWKRALGREVRRRRQHLGLAVADMDNGANINKTWLWKLEGTGLWPPLDKLRLLCCLLNCRMPELFASVERAIEADQKRAQK